MIAASSTISSTLVIGNRISEMEKVVALVEQFGAAHSVPNQAINELNLCLDEILNNTISYGYDEADHRSRSGAGAAASSRRRGDVWQTPRT
jgi:anti-sigma regulatory factor (Ser/Thr protein kinase)